MRAALHERYGPPEVLRVADVQRRKTGNVVLTVRA